MKCTQCQKDISEKVIKYSLEHYGIELCMDCQKNGKKQSKQKIEEETIRSVDRDGMIARHVALKGAIALAGIWGIEESKPLLDIAEGLEKWLNR